MEREQGSISDRPWGLSLGTLGVRRFTGTLRLASDLGEFQLRFCAGAIVAATSPIESDSALRVAVAARLVPVAYLAELEGAVATRAECDEIAVIGQLAGLTRDQIERLRHRVIAQRAARTFAAKAGEFALTADPVCDPRLAATGVDVRAVVYLGARVYVCEERLAAELAAYGGRFALAPGSAGGLRRFGFTPLERPVIDALAAGATIEELELRHRDPRTVHAVVYALLGCLACSTTSRATTATPTAVYPTRLAQRANLDPDVTPRQITLGELLWFRLGPSA